MGILWAGWRNKAQKEQPAQGKNDHIVLFSNWVDTPAARDMVEFSFLLPLTGTWQIQASKKQSFSFRACIRTTEGISGGKYCSSESLPQQDVFPGQCLPGETQESNEAQRCLQVLDGNFLKSASASCQGNRSRRKQEDVQNSCDSAFSPTYSPTPPPN